MKKPLVLVAILLTTCTFVPKPSTPAPTPIKKAQPDYMKVSPAPGSQIPIEFYEADLMEEKGLGGYEGSRPVDRVGYRSNVCVSIMMEDLGVSTEELWKLAESVPCDYPSYMQLDPYCYIIRRATLHVDGRELVAELDESWGAIGYANTSHWLCWPASLEPGIHEAIFQYRLPDESLEEYTWQFAITVSGISEIGTCKEVDEAARLPKNITGAFSARTDQQVVLYFYLETELDVHCEYHWYLEDELVYSHSDSETMRDGYNFGWLGAKEGEQLPTGNYRVDVTCGDTIVRSTEFRVWP
jgi:hypothetical protein